MLSVIAGKQEAAPARGPCPRYRDGRTRLSEPVVLTNRAVPVAADTDGAFSDRPQIPQSGGWKPETQGPSRLGPPDASVLHAPPVSSKSRFSVHPRPCRCRLTRRPITKVRAAW